MRVVYVGAIGIAGHHVWEWNPAGAYRGDAANLERILGRKPFNGRLAPQAAALKHRQGAAQCTPNHQGWTVLAWWDRSLDARPGASSALLVDAPHIHSAVMLEILCERFPEVYNRQPVPVEVTPVPEDEELPERTSDPWPAFIAGALVQLLRDDQFQSLGVKPSGLWPGAASALIHVAIDRGDYSDGDGGTKQYKITIEKLP